MLRAVSGTATVPSGDPIRLISARSSRKAIGNDAKTPDGALCVTVFCGVLLLTMCCTCSWQRQRHQGLFFPLRRQQH